MSTFAITCEVPPSVFARAITDAVLVQYSKRSLALPCSPFDDHVRSSVASRSCTSLAARLTAVSFAGTAGSVTAVAGLACFAGPSPCGVSSSESLCSPDLSTSRAFRVAAPFPELRCRGSSRLSTHRPIRDDSRSSRPFWDIEPGPLVLALRRSRPIQARHLDARTYLARARLAAIALVSARSPPGCSGRSACVHLSATACVPARSPCGARDRARTLHLTVRGPFSVHVRLGAHVRVLTRSPCGDRAHPRSRSPEQRHAYAAR